MPKLKLYRVYGWRPGFPGKLKAEILVRAYTPKGAAAIAQDVFTEQAPCYPVYSSRPKKIKGVLVATIVEPEGNAPGYVYEPVQTDIEFSSAPVVTGTETP